MKINYNSKPNPNKIPRPEKEPSINDIPRIKPRNNLIYQIINVFMGMVIIAGGILSYTEYARIDHFIYFISIYLLIQVFIWKKRVSLLADIGNRMRDLLILQDAHLKTKEEIINQLTKRP